LRKSKVRNSASRSLRYGVAVGSEEVAVHPVSRIDGGISRTTGVGRPSKRPGERGLKGSFGTYDPRLLTRAEVLAKIRAGVDAKIISPTRGEDLVALVELIA
jgi:hypothetical protein